MKLISYGMKQDQLALNSLKLNKEESHLFLECVGVLQFKCVTAIGFLFNWK